MCASGSLVSSMHVALQQEQGTLLTHQTGECSQLACMSHVLSTWQH